ncbi:hypothetical protein C5167_031545 [Papaver somniferum]|uniref:Uncharacterized protein n=1 Tax=Papaver somniferum TaxID=3469 RepID=A0A4Y7K629_PAPSO|nr:hypothetical protein C5167_031545 [Papaver somniferum]
MVTKVLLFVSGDGYPVRGASGEKNFQIRIMGFFRFGFAMNNAAGLLPNPAIDPRAGH